MEMQKDLKVKCSQCGMVEADFKGLLCSFCELKKVAYSLSEQDLKTILKDLYPDLEQKLKEKELKFSGLLTEKASMQILYIEKYNEIKGVV